MNKIRGAAFSSFRMRMILGTVLINLFVFTLTGYSLYNSWQESIRRIENTSENLVRALELSIDGIFDKVGVALAAVKYEAEQELGKGGMPVAAINDCIIRQRNNIPELDNVRIADAKGIIRYGVFEQGGPLANVSDRDYFTTLRDNPKAGLFIAKPVLGRISKKWIIIVALRIENPDGSFAGVVHGNIPLDFFRTHFAEFKLEKHGVITLRDSDLGVVVRYPEAKGVSVGHKSLSSEFNRLLKEGKTSGTYRNPGNLDSIQRIFSYRKLTQYPLYINVGLATGDFLGEWRSNSLKMGFLTLLFFVGTVISAATIIRKWSQIERATLELAQYRDELEDLVKERTAELEAKNRTLAKEVRVRNRAEASLQEQTAMLTQQVNERLQVQEELMIKQRQLAQLNEELEQRIADEVSKNREKDSIMLHQDKLASLGQLSAGIAHEINNPMGFIMSNLRTLKSYVDTLQQYVAALEKATHDDHQPDIDTLRRRLDLDFLLEDISPLLSQSIEGAERIKQIVLDLKNFARTDDNTMHECDLNQCIRSTANIVRNEIKYIADLDLELGSIPPVMCNPQQINQMIANLLINAAQAITDRGRITVATRHEGDRVFMTIADTGCGIEPEHIGRIFDPFFTTKPVGQGTGLGLSISYDIVKKNNGEITEESQPGAGTVFTVSLQISNQDDI